MHTPILFLIFNRPDTTERVFERIRKIKPKQLFVSADGPREDKLNENQKCLEARSIIEKVDWQCDLKTNFSEKNLGCRVAVSSGINWFFQNVEEGIILEDDCLPDLSFFYFCQTLLDYYRNDERIMHIGGANFQDGKVSGNGSYYFSKLSHIWGWATWKRAWDKYDVNMTKYHEMEQRLSEIFPDSSAHKYWKNNFDLVYMKRKDTWDIQWQYAVSINNGLTIVPNQGLISNIGFDRNATHTIDDFHTLANRPTSSITLINHPASIVPDLNADRYVFRKYMNPNKLKKAWQIIRRRLK